MASDRVRLSVDEARALGERALSGIGYDAEEARIIADHVIDAALCGYIPGSPRSSTSRSTAASRSRAGR
jgi:adenylate kinase